jgi:ABC-type transporter Mla MlaB component
VQFSEGFIMTQVTLTKNVIEKNKLQITNEHTSFVDLERFEHVDSFALLRRYQSIIKKAKEAGVDIKYTQRYKRRIHDLTEAYDDAFDLYNQLFDKLVKRWKDKIDKGLFVPLSDDNELNSIYELQNEIIAMNYRSEPISQMNDIANSLDNIEDAILSGDCVKVAM